MTTLDYADKLLRAKPGAEKDYKPEWDWDRYLLCEKMFAATCTPGETHAQEYAGHLLLTLKCDPEESEALQKEFPDILPAFYMDKRRWISIRLDGEVPRELIAHLCDASYELVLAKLPKKVQAQIAPSDKDASR